MPTKHLFVKHTFEPVISDGGGIVDRISSITLTLGKSNYTVGETFDLTGTTVVATYLSGKTKDVTTSCTFSPAEHTAFSNMGSVVVTATYVHGADTYTTTQTVTVADALSSISMTAPTKASYTEGENLDLTGAVVTATYVSGATADVTSSCTFSPANGTVLSTAGTQTITATYVENGITKTATVDVTVSAAIPSATWANGTWEEIEAMLDAHYDGRINIYDYWNVGDERTVALSRINDNLLSAATANGEMYHPAQDATIVLAHKGGKTITSGNRNGKECAFICHHKTALSSGYKNIYNSNINGKMNSSEKTSGWNGSDRRSWCNGDYYRGLPTALRNIVKYVQNKTAAVGGASIQTSSDVCFLPAYSEITGSSYKGGSQMTYTGEGTQWSYYANVANREKGNLPYWTRSPGVGANTPNYVYYQYTQGGEYSRSVNGGANYESIIPAFCI